MLWQLRPAKEDDLPLVYSSWLRSFRDSPLVAGISNTLYYAKYHDLIEEILKGPFTAVVVAVSPSDPTQIFGYCVAELKPDGNVLHWVYVKHAFRKFGLAKEMVSGVNPVIYTTRPGRQSSLVGSAVYDPFKLWSYAK